LLRHKDLEMQAGKLERFLNKDCTAQQTAADTNYRRKIKMTTGISKTLTIFFYLFCCVTLVWASGLSVLNRPFTGSAMKDNRLNTESGKTSIQNHPDVQHLDTSGDDEVKPSPEGLLLHILSFCVDRDGKLTDICIAAQNVLERHRIAAQVQVLGGEENNWDSAAWRIGTVYGTLLANFASA
jgi:hypothetical protein